jgi:CBS domain-containing protein
MMPEARMAERTRGRSRRGPRDEDPGAAMRVTDVMARSVTTVGHDATLADAWSIMQRRQVHHLPVLDADRRLIGMLTEHDLRLEILERCLREEPGGLARTLAGLRVNEIMTWAVITVGPDADIRDAARIMHDRGLGALPVAEEGRVIGMLTVTDVIRAILGATGKRSRGGGAGMDMCLCGHSEREHDQTGECRAAGCRCKHFKPEIGVEAPARPS